MPKHVPSLKPNQLIRLLMRGKCEYYREGKGDHTLYLRYVAGKKRVVPIDMGQKEVSPPYVLRIFRQFGFTDIEIEDLLQQQILAKQRNHKTLKSMTAKPLKQI